MTCANLSQFKRFILSFERHLFNASGRSLLPKPAACVDKPNKIRCGLRAACLSILIWNICSLLACGRNAVQSGINSAVCKEVGCHSAALVICYQTGRCHSLQDCNLHKNWSDSLKCHKAKAVNFCRQKKKSCCLVELSETICNKYRQGEKKLSCVLFSIIASCQKMIIQLFS